jgi:hypothetical protein
MEIRTEGRTNERMKRKELKSQKEAKGREKDNNKEGSRRNG